MPVDSTPSTDPQTIRSYDELAPIYLDHWRDRSFLDSDVRGYVALLPDRSFVLDVGCGPGFDTAALRSVGVNAFGLDRSWGMLRAGYVFGVPLLQGDMRQLPIAPGSLAGIWANACLLHLPRLLMPAVLVEFHRVLTAGGIIYVSVKLGQGSEQTETSYGRSAPRRFTYLEPEELDGLLSAAGFSTMYRAAYPLQNVTWLVRMAGKTESRPERPTLP